jgi:hypothetical protein
MKLKTLFLTLVVSMSLQAQLTWNFTSGMDGWHDLGAGRDVTASWENGKLKMTYIDGGNAGTQLWFAAVQVDNLSFNAADYKYLQINYQTNNWPTSSPVKMLVTLTKTDNSVIYSYFDIDPTKNFLSIDIQANNPGWGQVYGGTIKSVQFELPHNGAAASNPATNWYSATTLIDRVQFSNYKTTAWDFNTTTEGWGSYGGDLTLSNTGDGNLTVSHSSPSDGVLSYTAIYNDTPVDVSNVDFFYMKFTATNWPKTSALVNIIFEMGGTYYANKIMNVASGELSFNIRTENQNNWGPLPATGTTTRIRIEIPHSSELTGFNWATASLKIDRIAFSKVSDKTEAIVSSDVNLSSLVNNSTTELLVNTGSTLTINETTTLKSITTAPGAKVTLSSGTLTATNGITLQSDATGTATFVDNNNSSPQAVSGTVQQYLPQGRNWYLSVPTTSGNTSSLIGGGLATSVSYYSEELGWQNDYTGALAPGVGYIAVSAVGSGTSNTSFTGTLNSGDIPVTLTRKSSGTYAGYNLIANPYPSYINIMSAINANSNLVGTVWYRTRKTVSPYDYKFETVNTTSGVGTNSAGTGTVTGYIPPMQSFWVRTNVDGQVLTFTNAMRAHAGNVTVLGQPVPTTVMKAHKQVSQSIARIKVAGVAGSDEAVLYFDADAANTFDKYDSPKMFESASSVLPEIYTQAGTEKLVINGLNAVQYDTEIPLGFIAKTAGDYSISASEMSNFETGTRILLIDKEVPNTETELSAGILYPFSSPVASASTSRFSLIFRAPGTTTSVNEASKLSAQVFVNAANKITIVAPEKTTYSIYNAVGILLENGVVNSKPETINTKLPAGVYVVKVTDIGMSYSSRVIIK